MITAKKVSICNKSYGRIRKLYNEAFPIQERIPFELLVLCANAEWIDFLAFYDKGELCGFAYTISSNTLTSIMYLAVERQMRSQGYGSSILQYIQESYQNHTLALEVESPDRTAGNYKQQIRRKEFYFRNGFLESNYGVMINNVKYEVLRRGTSFRQCEWEQLSKRLTFGIVKFKLYNLS